MKDAAVFTVLFGVLLFVMGLFINVRYELRLSCISFLCFIAINALLYLFSLRTNFRRDAVSNVSAKAIMRSASVYMVGLTLIAVVTLSITLGVVFDGLSFHSQRAFFKERSASFFVNISSTLLGDENVPVETAFKNIEDNATLLYKSRLEKADAETLVNLCADESEMWEKEANVLVANTGAVHYISSKIPEAGRVNTQEDMVNILIYEGNHNARNLAGAKQQYAMYFETGKNLKFNVVIYNKAVDLISISNYSDWKPNSGYSRNPTILLQNSAVKQMPVYISQSVMYRITEEELSALKGEFQQPEHVNLLRTNVYEVYRERLNKYQYEAFLLGGVSLIFFFIMIVVVATVIRSRYDAYAVQYMIEQISGYTKIEQHRGVMILTGALVTGAAAIAFGLNQFLHMTSTPAILAAAMCIGGISFVTILFHIRRLDRAHRQKILKGGWV